MLVIFIPILLLQGPDLAYSQAFNCTTKRSTTFGPNTTYISNIDNLISKLSSNASTKPGFFSTNSSSSTSTAYGLLICRGDLDPYACQSCVSNAWKSLLTNCPNGSDAVLWEDNCMVRYSDQPLLSKLRTVPRLVYGNARNVSNATRVDQLVQDSMRDIVNRVANVTGEKKYGKKEVVYSSVETVYCMMQCTPDLSPGECRLCLDEARTSLRTGQYGCRVVMPSCNARFEFHAFYNYTPTPAGVSSPPPPPPDVSSLSLSLSLSQPVDEESSEKIIPAVAGAAGLAMVLIGILIIICLGVRIRKKLGMERIVPLNTWILISNFKLAYNLLRRPDGTFNRELAEFLDCKVPANTVPVDGVFSFDIIDKTTNLLNRVYRPINGGGGEAFVDLENPLSTTHPVPVIVYFHGGSFTHSSANSAIYDSWCRRLVRICDGGAVVVSVNYRRSPEHRYPCAYDDGWNAVKWVSTRSWLRSGKPEDSKVRIYLAGDSSGGNIAHHVAVRASSSNTDDDHGVEILGNILLHPMFGGEKRTESEERLDGKYFVTVKDRDWYWRAYLPEGSDRDHPACNIFGGGGGGIKGVRSGGGLEGLKGFPKSLVVVAGLDLVQDWQLKYVEGVRRSGHEVKLLYLENATIGFYFLPNNDHFRILKDEIREFVNPGGSGDGGGGGGRWGMVVKRMMIMVKRRKMMMI